MSQRSHHPVRKRWLGRVRQAGLMADRVIAAKVRSVSVGHGEGCPKTVATLNPGVRTQC